MWKAVHPWCCAKKSLYSSVMPFFNKTLIYLFIHSTNVYWSSTKYWAIFYISNKTYENLFYSSKKRERISKRRRKVTCLLRKFHNKWESEKCLRVGVKVKSSKGIEISGGEGKWQNKEDCQDETSYVDDIWE